MENGLNISRAGSGDRHGTSQRRKTISGALDRLSFEDHDPQAPPEVMKFPLSSPSAPSSPTYPPANLSTKSTSHKRSLSGNILAKFNLFRSFDEDKRPSSRGKEPQSPKSTKSRKSIDDDVPVTSPTSPGKADSAMAFALRAPKMRKRKGSLRKTALLGGRRIGAEGRERRNSLLQQSESVRLPEAGAVTSSPVQAEDDASSILSFESGPDTSAIADNSPELEGPLLDKHIDTEWRETPAVTAARLSLVTGQQDQLRETTVKNELGSPLDIKSPISQASYASTTTTDDDDVLTFDHPASTFAMTQSDLSLQQPLSSAATSYFPSISETSLPRHRATSKNQRSPLSHTISSSSVYPTDLSPEPHSYTETEYWGWVILFVTWLTFTVGMGSCLEIWSWAWDVGETPYAPPELEDDPTLPIVGYYPALIVLTGVVAWVWITVAWVGMKYFRHAKIEV